MTDQTTPATDHIIPVHVKFWGIIALVIGAFIVSVPLFSQNRIGHCEEYATIGGEFQTALYNLCADQTLSK